VALTRNELGKVRGADAGDADGLAQVENLLAAAEQAATRPGSRIRLWLNGSAINRSFVNLHAAQVLLASYTPHEDLDLHLLSAMTRLRATMPCTAERRRELESHYRDATSIVERKSLSSGALRRWVLQKALEWSYAATDAQYARLRNFRNIVTGVSIAVMGFAVGLALMGFFWPATLQLCFGEAGNVCPTGSSPSGKDALVIEVLGAAGGALAAVLAVRKIQGTSTPYSVPLALAMLKLPFGALTALLGLVLIHGRFVPGLTDLDTSGQILAYAIVLGVVQHAATSLIDRRGQELLSGIPHKRSTAGPAESPTARLESELGERVTVRREERGNGRHPRGRASSPSRPS